MKRIMGLETEYALFFYPDDEDGEIPDSRLLAENLLRKLRARGPAVDALHVKTGVTLANGGMASIEVNPLADIFHIGLIETSTPETTSPRETVRYQAAMQRLLSRAVRDTTEAMRLRGYRGRVVILKNSVDFHRNTYGSHENYYVRSPTGIRRTIATIIHRLGFLFLLPFYLLVFLLGFLRIGLEAAMVRIFRRMDLKRGGSRAEGFIKWTGWERFWMYWVELPFSSPIILYSFLLYKLMGCPLHRKYLAAHLLTRPIYCGSGWFKNGELPQIMQKAHDLTRIDALMWLSPGKKPLFDGKAFYYKPSLLLEKRQRMHVIYADNNPNEYAEWLRLSVTELLVSMIEAGQVEGLPLVESPSNTAVMVSCDLSLSEKIPFKVMENGGKTVKFLTALEIQQIYLKAAKIYCGTLPDKGSEYTEVLREWSRTLLLLEHNPDALRDRIDWIAKKTLLGSLDDPETWETVDMKYHEIDSREGYREWLAADGLSEKIVGEAEVESAMQFPPADTRASYRGKLVRWMVENGIGPSLVGWDAAYLRGGRFGIRRLKFRDPENPRPRPDPDDEFGNKP